MALELVYTSAPKGLKAGSSGYCTVACTSGMPPTQVDLLESFSGYKALFDSGGPDEGRNPVSFSHYRPRVAGKTLSVLSRVSSYGFDYSGRTNKLAHHVIVEPAEQGAGGPASLLLTSGFMVTQWSGDARSLPNPKNVPNISSPRGPARQWEKVTGDAGWAGVLAQGFTGPESAPVYLVIEPGMDVLPLIYEASLILRPELRWQVTFSTYLSTLPASTSCHWRCCLPDSPILAEARRARSGLVIDLRLGRELGSPKAAEDYLEAARTGKPIAAATPRKVVASRASSVPDENDFEIRILEEEEVSEVPEREDEPQTVPRRINSVEPRLPKVALPLVASVVIGIVAIAFLVSALSSTPKGVTQRKDLADGVNAAKVSDSAKISNRSEPQLRPAPNGGDTPAQPVKPSPKIQEPVNTEPKADKESPAKPKPGKEDTSKAEPEKPTDTSKEPRKVERPAPSPAAEVSARTVVEFRLTDLPGRLVDQSTQLTGLAVPPLEPGLTTSLQIEWIGKKNPDFLREIKPEGPALHIYGNNPYGGQGEFFVVNFKTDSFIFKKAADYSDKDWASFRKEINFISVSGSRAGEEYYRCYFKPVELEVSQISVDVIDDLPMPPRIPLRLHDKPHSLPQFTPEARVETDIAKVVGKIVADKESCTDKSIELIWPPEKEDQIRKLNLFRKLMESQRKGLLELIGKPKEEANKKKAELKKLWQEVPKEWFRLLPGTAENPDKWYLGAENLWSPLDAAEKKRQSASDKEKDAADKEKTAAQERFNGYFGVILKKCMDRIKLIQTELVPEHGKVLLRVLVPRGQDAISIKLVMKCTAKEK